MRSLFKKDHMKPFFLKKIESNRGQLVSFFLVYPVLLVLVSYGVLVFIQSTTTSNQLRIQYNRFNARYAAHRGLEYTFYEILEHSIGNTPFFTHDYVPGNQSIVNRSGSLPTPSVAGTTFFTDADGSIHYALVANGVPIFESKIYQINKQYFVLSKSTFADRNFLYFLKIDGNPLFDYLSFYQNDANFGWQTLDAGGGRIHTNKNMKFFDGVEIANVSELSAAGNYSWDYNLFVEPSDYAGGVNSFPLRRWPYVTPAGYGPSNPPPGDQSEGNTPYTNTLDGHYAGERTGLYEYDSVSARYRPWTPASGLLPIWPWDAAPANQAAWYDYANNQNHKWIYQENDVNCWKNSPSTCAKDDPVTNNSNFYEKSVKINGKYIPSRLSTGYTTDHYGNPTNQYYGNIEGDENYPVYATDSQKQAPDWLAYLTQLDLLNTIKDKDTGDAKVITPPRINPTQLLTNASNQSMIIRRNAGTGDIRVQINGTLYEFNQADGGWGSGETCSGGQNLFEYKQFMNHKFGLVNEAVMVNVTALEACAASEGSTKWLPTNGHIINLDPKNIVGGDFGTVSVGLKNAQQLPAGGLTTIVQGNFFIQGHYNYSPANDPDWAWQPSAAIVSDRVTLLSDNYTYPAKLPISQHHSNYPEEFNYDGNILPAGTGADKNYTPGYNWNFTYDPDLSNPLKMPNRVKGGVDTDGDNVFEYHYGITLAGKYAVTPDLLEMWEYYDEAGDNNTPPNPQSWRANQAVVTGSFVELDDEFPVVDGTFVPTVPNDRSCFQSGPGAITASDITGAPFSLGSYPCRQVGKTPPWDFLAKNNKEEHHFESRYKTVGTPPGGLTGFFEAFLVELPFTQQNWTHHHPGLL